jgi:hypothetical protein
MWKRETGMIHFGSNCPDIQDQGGHMGEDKAQGIAGHGSKCLPSNHLWVASKKKGQICLGLLKMLAKYYQVFMLR